MNNLLYLVVIFLAAWWLIKTGVENFGGTSPGVYDQLAAGSGYYPWWRYQWAYNWPYYRFIYPYYANFPTYANFYRRGTYPKPWGWYN